MTFVVIGIVLALALGAFTIPYALLFKPWRVKQLAYWLYNRSSLYRRWHIRWFVIRPMRKTTRAMAALGSAAKRAAAETAQFAEVLKRMNVLPPQSEDIA